jgi:adenylate cyclase
MLQTGESLLRRRLSAAVAEEFDFLPHWLAAGMTDYVAMIARFATEGVIGDMDCVYTSWATRAPDGFEDHHVATLDRVVPFLALAIKAVSLTRMTSTLLETYLGRDPGRRVLAGKIVRGLAEEIDAVVWFSDLAGFTRIPTSRQSRSFPC